ncbi:MAG: thioesterase family protein [Planctomycetota bacterium]
MVFRKSYRYRFGDIDDAGIAYYPRLLHYFHCAMEDWWADGLGKSYRDVMYEEHFGLPAVKLEAEFYEPIRYGDEPVVHIGVLRIGTTSVELGFWMTRGDDPRRAACRARIVTAGVDMRSFAPKPVPEHWRAALARYALAEADFPGRPGKEERPDPGPSRPAGMQP